MADRWLGVVVSGDRVCAVDAEVPPSGPLVIQAVQDWSLQKGDRSTAYALLHRVVADYVHEHKIKRVVIKASAGSGKGGATNALLHSAELRGVVMSSCASSCQVSLVSVSGASKTFGSRKIAEYVKDDDFWDQSISGANVKKGARDAAMMLLIRRDD